MNLVWDNIVDYSLTRVVFCDLEESCAPWRLFHALL